MMSHPDVPYRGMITLSIMAATIMQVLDTTIANVALPHMQGGLNATQEQASWILTSYIVASAITMAATGFIAGRFGRKRLFVISIAGFTVSSMLCGMATNLPEMVVFRLMQGVFGASLVPLSQAVLLDINPRERHGQAMAMWGMGIMVAPILGPVLGGWLTEMYNWRWVFYINVPVGAAALLGVITFLPETERHGRRFDFFGFLMLALAIGALQLMLDRGQSEDWFSSTEIIVCAVITGLCFYLFIVHTLTAEHPFLDPVMFRDRNYVTSLVFVFLVGIVLLATMALLPPYLQNLGGYPVITTGMVMAPRGMGTMVSMMLAGRLLGRVDARFLILAGLSLTALSLWEMSLFPPEPPMGAVIRTGVIQGLGLGMVFIPLSTLAYATLPYFYRNDATAIFSLARNIGSSIGISIMFTLLSRNTQVNHAELVTHLPAYGNGFNALDAYLGLSGAENSAAALTALNGEVTRQATAISFFNDFRLMFFIVLSSIPLLFVLKSSHNQPTSEDIEIIE